MENVHHNGLAVLARYPELDRSKLSQPTDKCLVLTGGRFKRKFKCGHYGMWWFKISIFGSVSEKIHQKEYCPDCFIKWYKERTIFCSLCGLPIFPGEGVALYDKNSEGVREDSYSVGNSVIGCLRMNCCLSGGFFAGHWTEEGFKVL